MTSIMLISNALVLIGGVLMDSACRFQYHLMLPRTLHGRPARGAGQDLRWAPVL